MTPGVTGFVVHAFVQSLERSRSSADGSRLALLGRLDDGCTFAAVFEPYRPFYYLRRSDAADRFDANLIEDSDRTTMDGEPVVVRRCNTVSELRREVSDLQAQAVRTYEADLSPTDSALIDAHVHGSVEITGQSIPGNSVDLVFMNPTIAPSNWDPELEILSIDIETNPNTGKILAVGMVSTGRWGAIAEEIHLVGPALSDARMISHDNEQRLLETVVGRISEIDPDIITGWNVIDFDFSIISSRLAYYRIPFHIARSNEPAQFLPAGRDNSGRRQNAGVSCQGRQVLDGLRLLRYGPQRFADRKLDSVANTVLGEGKTVTAETSADKIETLLSLYRDDPQTFCEYCLNDAALVLRILEKTGLLTLTIKRSRLIGIGINRAWTSIPAFEFLYIEAMHDRGLVAPSKGVDLLPGGDVPGGAILKPEPGVFNNVLVFDFKSLYPSLMRTFNIDPVGYVDSDEGYPEGGSPPPPGEMITAPNGARYRRERAILPAILDRFWESRDEAKAHGDEVASYVYKIVMNSFYGVLGSGGCRFAGAPLAGAITGFGQYILHWARDRFVEAGYRVIYGDTDSLFVLAGEDCRDSPAELYDLGNTLCDSINNQLNEFVQLHYQVEPQIELEFEKLYTKFYLPRIRHTIGLGATAEEARGRAKGYAGLPIAHDGTVGELDVKGMEAIRSDWTDAARVLQMALLARLFSGATPAEIEAFVRDTIASLRAGELDDQLVYSRALRKSVSEYTKNRPPHVQAASLLSVDRQEGTIHYLITDDGPQPVGHVNSSIDYAHYIEKQIRPIAEPICEIVGVDTQSLFDPTQQLSLF